MNEKIRNFLIILVTLAILGGGYYFSRKSNQQEDNSWENQKISAFSINKTKNERVIQELISKYSPLTDWYKNISYTYQLQERLIDSGKLILFIGKVDDIFRKEDKYFINFVVDKETIPPKINFTLECEQHKLSEILKKAEGNLGDDNANAADMLFDLVGLSKYAVVAKINNIRKVKLQIEGNLDGEDVGLEYSLSDTFIASGKCVDFSYFPYDGADDKLLYPQKIKDYSVLIAEMEALEAKNNPFWSWVKGVMRP